MKGISKSKKAQEQDWDGKHKEAILILGLLCGSGV